jgi:hypothetical protein
MGAPSTGVWPDFRQLSDFSPGGEVLAWQSPDDLLLVFGLSVVHTRPTVGGANFDLGATGKGR